MNLKYHQKILILGKEHLTFGVNLKYHQWILILGKEHLNLGNEP